MKTEVAKLTPDETKAYRLLAVKIESLASNPAAYSAQETEDITRRRHTFWQEMTDKHNLRGKGGYTVDFTTGILFETDE